MGRAVRPAGRRLSDVELMEKPLGICVCLARPVHAAACFRWLFKGLQKMTTYVAVYVAAWAAGYVLGFKVRAVRTVIYAS